PQPFLGILLNHLASKFYFCYPVSGRKHDQHPTILHWAAAHGLKELSSALLSAPSATLACKMTNADDHDPQDLARRNGHFELSDLLDEFIVSTKIVPF
ncbi:B-cell scaffold protein with ankyrin repeats, partial [Plakobranchus ocellatus]